MREKAIENYFVKQVKLMGGLALKLTSPSIAGLPDRLVLLPKGVIFFAELKATGQKPRKLQKFIHKNLQELGFRVYVIDSKEQVKEVLEREIYTA